MSTTPIDRFLDALFRHSADELILETGRNVRLVVGGQERNLLAQTLRTHQIESLIGAAVPVDQLGSYRRDGEVKFDYDCPSGPVEVRCQRKGAHIRVRVRPRVARASAGNSMVLDMPLDNVMTNSNHGLAIVTGDKTSSQPGLRSQPSVLVERGAPRDYGPPPSDAPIVLQMDTLHPDGVGEHPMPGVGVEVGNLALQSYVDDLGVMEAAAPAYPPAPQPMYARPAAIAQPQVLPAEFLQPIQSAPAAGSPIAHYVASVPPVAAVPVAPVAGAHMAHARIPQPPIRISLPVPTAAQMAAPAAVVVPSVPPVIHPSSPAPQLVRVSVPAAAPPMARAPLGMAPTPVPMAPAPAPRAPAPRPVTARPIAAGNGQGPCQIDPILRTLASEGGSDLHLTAGQLPRMRKDGDICSVPGFNEPLSSDTIESWLIEIATDLAAETFRETHDADYAYEIEGVSRFRVNLFRDRNGVGSVMRTIPSKVLTADQLGLPPAVRRLCNLHKGLVTVTGPTGSGKSTTLAAMIDLINKTRPQHIITIEDPVEFVHHPQKCLVNQREVHMHTKSFSAALRAALREDPDIVLVGEMRDLETISIALETAETGHLVFGTLHTNTAISTVDRIIDQFPVDRQAQVRVMLSESLSGVIAQTLCKKIGGGRVAALEILIATPAVSNLIREGKTFQITSLLQTGRNIGMQTLNDALGALVKDGKVDAQQAFEKSLAKSEMKMILKRLGHKVEE